MMFKSLVITPFSSAESCKYRDYYTGLNNCNVLHRELL